MPAPIHTHTAAKHQTWVLLRAQRSIADLSGSSAQRGSLAAFGGSSPAAGPAASVSMPCAIPQACEMSCSSIGKRASCGPSSAASRTWRPHHLLRYGLVPPSPWVRIFVQHALPLPVAGGTVPARRASATPRGHFQERRPRLPLRSSRCARRSAARSRTAGAGARKVVAPARPHNVRGEQLGARQLGARQLGAAPAALSSASRVSRRQICLVRA